jgi:asparagine N-glycosylation enzyme membrane subunit Stt3
LFLNNISEEYCEKEPSLYSIIVESSKILKLFSFTILFANMYLLKEMNFSISNLLLIVLVKFIFSSFLGRKIKKQSNIIKLKTRILVIVFFFILMFLRIKRGYHFIDKPLYSIFTFFV